MGWPSSFPWRGPVRHRVAEAPRVLLRWLGPSALVVVFGVAAVAKMNDFESFRDAIVKSALVTEGLTRPVAGAVIGLEIALALGLLLGTRWVALRTPALGATTMVCSGLLAYSLWRWYRGISAPCH